MLNKETHTSPVSLICCQMSAVSPVDASVGETIDTAGE